METLLKNLETFIDYKCYCKKRDLKECDYKSLHSFYISVGIKLSKNNKNGFKGS